MAPRNYDSSQVANDVYTTGGSFGGSQPPLNSQTGQVPYPPVRPASFPQVPPPPNVDPTAVGLGLPAGMASAPLPPPPGPAAAPPTMPSVEPTTAAGLGMPVGLGAPPELGGNYPPASSLPGPGHLDVYSPPPAPAPSPGPAHLSVYSAPTPTPSRAARPAALPAAAPGRVPLPPRRPAGLGAPAPTQAPYPPPQPIAHVAGPAWLRSAILAGQRPPGGPPTVGNTMASMLMNRGQGGGNS